MGGGWVYLLIPPDICIMMYDEDKCVNTILYFRYVENSLSVYMWTHFVPILILYIFIGVYLVVDFQLFVAWEIFLFRSLCGRTVVHRRLLPRTADLSVMVACKPRTRNIPRDRRDWVRRASRALWLPKARHTDRIWRRIVWNRR